MIDPDPDPDSDIDDLRKEELETLSAIFQDALVLDLPGLKGEARIPLQVENGIPVHLINPDGKVLRTSEVRHLPPLKFKFLLPQGYPYEKPPEMELSSLIVSDHESNELKQKLLQHWIDTKDQVLFTMIDEFQEKAAYLHNFTGQEIRCEDIEYEQILEHDLAEKQKEFDGSTFTCEICQDDLKGVKCVSFESCGHVFCNNCLRNFFVSLIKDGDVEKIHCPDFECGKNFLKVREKYLRLENMVGEKFDFEEFKTLLMTPPITLSILQKILGEGEGEDSKLFNKYLTLFTSHQNAVIAKLFPSRLVSCPREKCPAMIFRENMNSRLVICRTCDYAFCNTCRKSYHSDSIDCSKKVAGKPYCGIPIEALDMWLLSDKNSKERDALRYKYGYDLLTKVSNEYVMDKLFNEMLLDASHGFSKCPTCDLIIQRLEGCNKMKCSSCTTLFCNLCGIYLDYDHPYDHFNAVGSTCYGKLFHGMPGLD